MARQVICSAKGVRRKKKKILLKKPPRKIFFGDFREAVKFLRTHLPPAYPVRVLLTNVEEDDAGNCDLTGKGNKKVFVIRISRSLAYDAAILVLLHEYAHCLAWTYDHSTVEDHAAEWGLAYSRVYRCWFETD